MAQLQFTLDGRQVAVEADPGTSLLEVLRDDFGLRAVKDGCSPEGSCGACTVIVDGKPINSCLMLAAEADGADVLTVEGLAQEGRLDALQQAFLETGAAQCGFCIPGQLMAARALLERSPHPTAEEINEALAGNLCRCAGYEQIRAAVLAAAGEVRS